MRKKSSMLFVTSLPDYRTSVLYNGFGYSSTLKPVIEDAYLALNSP